MSAYLKSCVEALNVHTTKQIQIRQTFYQLCKHKNQMSIKLSRECNFDGCKTIFHAPIPPLVAHKLLVKAIYVKILPLAYNVLATLYT